MATQEDELASIARQAVEDWRAGRRAGACDGVAIPSLPAILGRYADRHRFDSDALAERAETLLTTEERADFLAGQ